MIDITVNGDKQSVNSTNITDLLKELSVKMPDMVSVQHNDAMLDRQAFDSTVISKGDTIEFLYFMGGGQL